MVDVAIRIEYVQRGVLGLPERRSFSKYEVMLCIASLLALVIQLYIAPHTTSRVDIAYYLQDAMEIVDQKHYFDFYRHTVYEYPPVWAYYISLVYILRPVTNWRDPGFLTMVKLPLILSDVIAGILVFYYVRKDVDARKAFLGSILLLFHPHLTFISAMWGMNDSICTMFLLLSVFLLKDDRLKESAISMSLALLMKQYAAIPLVLILALILKRQGIRESCVYFAIVVLPLIIISIPYLLADPEPYFQALTFSVFKPQVELRLKSGGFWRLIKYIIENHTTIETPKWLITIQYPFFLIGYLFTLSFFYLKIPDNNDRVDRFLTNDAVLLPVLYFLIFCPVVHPQWYVLLMPFICIRLVLMKRNSELAWYIPTLFPFIHHFMFISSIKFDSTEPLDTFIHMVWDFRSETQDFWYVPVRTSIFIGLFALFLRLIIYYEQDLRSISTNTPLLIEVSTSTKERID